MTTLAYPGNGEKVPYTPATAKSANDVVVLDDGQVGIVPVDIAASAEGVLVIRGIHTLAKTSGIAFTDGQRLYWDESNSELTNVPAAHAYVGRAVNAATSAATTAAVNLNADDSGANLVAITLSVASGAAADVSHTVRRPLRVIDVIAQHTGGAGEASDTLTIKNGTDAITDAIDWSGADKAVVRAGTIDDAYATLAVGDTIVASPSDADAGDDLGAGTVTVLAVAV